MIALALRALARTWPELLAWFLAGWAARLLLLRFAGWAAEYIDPLAGQALVPLAILARLASYIAMFLVLRPALTRYERLEEFADRRSPSPSPNFFTAWAGTIGAALVPFFVIYAAWGLIAEDARAYASAALDQSDFTGPAHQTPLDTPFTWQTITIVVAAFVLRRVMARFARRLPRWTGVIAVYLEAVWVFIALGFIGDLIAGVPDWLATRRMFAWAVDGWARLRADFTPLQWLGDAFHWLSVQAGEVIFQPLAWLALGAIVLAGALPVVARRTSTRTTRAREAAARRWQRVGPRTRRILMLPVNGLIERWQPVGTALRLIWQAGPVTLGTYVLGFTVLAVGSDWLHVALYHAFGPHELGWWVSWDQPLELLIDAIVVPLQLCLVAAAFDRCLRALDTRVGDAAALSALEGAAVSGSDRRP